MKRASLILGLAVLLCGATSAQASTIFYTVTAKGATGTLGTLGSFTDAAVTIDFQSTQPVESDPPNWVQIATGTVMIEGLGTATFTIPVVAFVAQPNSPGCSHTQPACIAGIGEKGGSGISLPILGTKNGEFKNWSNPLNSDFGPIHGEAIFFSSPPVPFGTTVGGLSFQSITGNTCFQASTTGSFSCTTTPPPPVPEPGSLMLVGTGLISLIGFTRRRLS